MSIFLFITINLVRLLFSWLLTHRAGPPVMTYPYKFSFKCFGFYIRVQVIISVLAYTRLCIFNEQYCYWIGGNRKNASVFCQFSVNNF